MRAPLMNLKSPTRYQVRKLLFEFDTVVQIPFELFAGYTSERGEYQTSAVELILTTMFCQIILDLLHDVGKQLHHFAMGEVLLSILKKAVVSYDLGPGHAFVQGLYGIVSLCSYEKDTLDFSLTT